MPTKLDSEITPQNKTFRQSILDGFLQWNHAGDSLAQLVSSTTHAKVILDGRIVDVGKLKPEPHSERIKAHPGTVIKIDEFVWHVAAANGVVSISDFLDENGQPIAAQTLANECHIIEGKQLPNLTPECVEWLEMISTQAKPEQPHWIKRLAKFDVPPISTLQNNIAKQPTWAATDYRKISEDCTPIEVVVAWLIYIARDAEISPLQIGWDVTEYFRYDNETCNASSPVPAFAKIISFDAIIDANSTFSDVVASVEKCYERLINNLLDLPRTFIRYISDFCDKKSWTLAVSLIDKNSEHKHSGVDANDIDSNIFGSLITLQINKKNEEFRWIYDANQIWQEEIDCISSRLIVLIASARRDENAKKPVSQLELLSKSERELLLYTWNQTMIPTTQFCCLQQLFETQVERNEMDIAVDFDGKTLSYSELNVRANRLAHYLIVQGVKPDDHIALCVERGTPMIVAILSILKAGCAYVPLDPVYKSQRLTNILLDANPVLLLTDATGRDALGDHQVSMINLDTPLATDLPVNNPDTTKLGLNPTHLAYTIYTSGSTGTPKGVMVEHRQVIRLFSVTQEKFDFNKQDKWCMFHSFSFDVSVWEMWNTFYYGSQLSIAPYKITRSTDDFYDWLCNNIITVLNQTPSAFKILIRRVRNVNLRPNQLRYIIFAGEELDPLIAQDWYEKSGTKIVNMYGPTETLHATIYQFGASENNYSIGRPLSDLCVYLLNTYGVPVPLGVVGEICVSGAGVARGYLNKSELNAEHFQLDPFNELPGVRLYRTGDLARYLSDGNLVFLGRADKQVKIRGFRIELGEIEALLVEHPNVYEAVVQSYGNASDARFVAYVVADSDQHLAENLRTYLSKQLPDYMVPLAYVRLQSLPLTPTGKVDQRALPASDETALARRAYEAPQGEMEEKLANIWSDLLGVDRIGRFDNFFALGGNSLLIPMLLTELRENGLNTTVSDVFDAHTLAILATTLSRYKAVAIPPNLITENSIEITPEMLPLITLSQADINTIIRQVPGGVANIQDIYGLTPLQSGLLYHHLMAKQGDLYLLISRMRFHDQATLQRYADAAQYLAKKYDILRTAIFWDGLSETAQVVLRQVPSLLSEITLKGSADEEIIEQLSQKFNPNHFRLDLTQAPLMRIIAAPVSNGTWVALQLIHHTIVDHFTVERLQEEIHASMDGNHKMLATSPKFRHFVAQTRLGTNPTGYVQLFTEMLGDIDGPTLPFGLSDIDHNGFEINEACVELPQSLNDQLRAHARNLRVSVATVCHLAWANVLARACGHETVVFGTMLLGRLQAGERNNTIMGPLFNTLPIRLNIDERGIESAVRDTHSRLSALLAHVHAPLVLAQRCSGVPAGLPLFSALLNFRHNQEAVNSGISPPGISMINFIERTNFPVTLSIEDDGNSLGLTAQTMSSIRAIRICAYMQTALESLSIALTCSPQQPVRNLTVMPPDERSLLLHSWNQSTMSHSPDYCLHQMFEAQVEYDGRAIALECEVQTLSYVELNTQANRLAHHLISQGVKPDDRIAICVERSISMIVAILGIMKAGCAYVPLDPAYSSKRVTNILLDANPVFLLADATGHTTLREHQVPMIDLEKPLHSGLPIDNQDNIKLGLNPTHLAYIIYTSGTTGTPKGVMVEHRQVVQLFGATLMKIDFNREDRWCLFHSISFDFSVWEIWGALIVGSSLSIVTYNNTRSTDEFYDWICDSSITVLNQTPSAFKMLIRVMNINSSFGLLRYIVLGAEWLDPAMARNWYEKFKDTQVILLNLYGPTETTVCATYQRLETLENIYTIGRPLPHLYVYLLDTCNEPTLLGAVGEIYISGSGVSRGYQNRPELTIERFLSDPFHNDPSVRMYRTGDLAKYQPDGNLTFLGRADQQVKIRGFRIELGEIETRLVEHPQVQEVVVQPCGHESDVRLVAYVVALKDESLVQDLRAIY